MSNGLLKSIVNYVGGIGITITGRSIATDPTIVEQLVNKNANGGYLGLDATGIAEVDGLIPRTGTYPELKGVAPEDGEIGTTNDLPRIYAPAGDGVWWPLSFNSTALLYITPDEDQIANGIRLADAYTRIQSFTPNGAALSATNRATLLLAGGRFELGARLDLVNFCDIIGIRTTDIICGADTVNKDFNYQSLATDVNLGGLRFSVKGTHIPMLNITGAATILFNHVDLQFITALSTDKAMIIGTGGTTFAGNCTNVITNGTQLYGDDAAFPIIFTGEFRNCIGGDFSFGGNQFNRGNPSSGKITACTMFGTSWGATLGNGAIFTYNDWGASIAEIESSVDATSPRVAWSRIKGQIGDTEASQPAGQRIRISHCQLEQVIDSNITNVFGTDAAAFNLVNADI